MAWRLRPAAGQASEERPSKVAKKSAADSDEEESDMRSMVANLQRLSLYQQQTLRQLCSSVWTTWKLDSSLDVVVDGHAAAQRYHDTVMKDKTGHGLGSPHIHIAMAVFEGLAKMATKADCKQEYTYMTIVLGYLEAKGPSKVDELVPFLRLKDLYGGRNTKGSRKKSKKGKTDDLDIDEGDGAKDNKSMSILMFQLNPLAELEFGGDGIPDNDVLKVKAIYRCIEKICIHFKGEKGSGMAPPMSIERVVQKDLNSLMKS